jgi:alpha-beta hydrolase superfamily lysophospholipase
MPIEYFFRAEDGQALFAREWLPEPSQYTRAAVILVHGIGEHCGRYAHVAAFFLRHDIATLGFDLRGHGLSHGARGDTSSYRQLLDDIALRVRHARALWPDRKVILYGHSLGGNLAINYVLRRMVPFPGKDPVDGVIASGPELRLGFKPPAWKMAMANLLAVAAPGFALPSGLDVNAISHDPAVIHAYRTDPLVHDLVTSRLFLGFYRAGEWALQHASQWPASSDYPLPTLLSYGTADQLVSPEAIGQFAEQSGNRAIVSLPWQGFFHEVHNEPDHPLVVEAYRQWMEDSGLLIPSVRSNP